MNREPPGGVFRIAALASIPDPRARTESHQVLDL